MPEAEKPTTPLTPAEPPELDERALRDLTLWMSIDEAFERLVERVRYGEVAAGELQRALEGGLPCRGISEIGRKRVLFAPATWRDQYRLYPASTLSVIHRSEQRRGGNIVRTVRDWRFYVLRTAFEAIWSTSDQARLTDTEEEEASYHKTWVIPLAQQMKTAGKIPPDIEKMAFARKLAERCPPSVTRRKSLHRYICNQLNGWGLWPVDLIKIKNP